MTHYLDAMPRARILLTGGSGFVGSALLDAFRSSSTESEIFATSRRAKSMVEDDKRIHWISRNKVNLPEGIEYIVHLEPDPDGRSTEWIAQTAGAIGARVLYASSGAAASLTTVYAQSKRASERLMAEQSFASRFPLVIARMWTFMGPYLPLDQGYAAGNFIRDALAGGPIVIRGDGKAVRSYMHTSDLAEWLWKILLYGTNGVIYNVGSEYAITIRQLALMIAAEFERKIGIVAKYEQGVPSTRYVPDVSATCNELGLLQQVSLSQAIQLTIGWFKEHDQRFISDKAE